MEFSRSRQNTHHFADDIHVIYFRLKYHLVSLYSHSIDGIQCYKSHCILVPCYIKSIHIIYHISLQLDAIIIHPPPIAITVGTILGGMTTDEIATIVNPYLDLCGNYVYEFMALALPLYINVIIYTHIYVLVYI